MPGQESISGAVQIMNQNRVEFRGGVQAKKLGIGYLPITFYHFKSSAKSLGHKASLTFDKAKAFIPYTVTTYMIVRT